MRGSLRARVAETRAAEDVRHHRHADQTYDQSTRMSGGSLILHETWQQLCEATGAVSEYHMDINIYSNLKETGRNTEIITCMTRSYIMGFVVVKYH